MKDVTKMKEERPSAVLDVSLHLPSQMCRFFDGYFVYPIDKVVDLIHFHYIDQRPGVAQAVVEKQVGVVGCDYVEEQVPIVVPHLGDPARLKVLEEGWERNFLQESRNRV